MTGSVWTMVLRRSTVKGVAIGAVCAWATGAAACMPSYEVQRGDTLSGIAETVLGSVFAYPQIHARNRAVIGDDPDMIHAGAVLSMPCDLALLEELDWTVMPTPAQAAHLMERVDIQVLDIRAAAKLEGGVLPGAVWSGYAAWRGPDGNPGGVPSDADLSGVISDLGLDLTRPILIVHDKEHPMATGRAARVYWLLKSVGAEQLAILRGGMKGWQAAGLPVAPEARQPQGRAVTVSMSDQWYADSIDVYGVITDQIPGHLLDARPHGLFAKLDKAGEALASTLPGAGNVPAPPLMAALRGEMDVADGAQRVIDYMIDHDVAFGRDSSVITFCHTGELAALNWFYASELAALPGVKLYPDSIKGWTAMGGILSPGGAPVPDEIAKAEAPAANGAPVQTAALRSND